ncbi:MAG: hypothetical protein K2P19_06275 [Kineothrix sp.]|nr:hypothetical protein [Kineothrix sp.]
MISHSIPFSAMYLSCAKQDEVDEEEGYRKFGGCLPVWLPVRDMLEKYAGNCKTKTA